MPLKDLVDTDDADFPDDIEEAAEDLLQKDEMENYGTELANFLYLLREDGVGGGLDGNFEQGEAIVYAGDGEYVSEPIDVDRQTIVLEAGESKEIDASTKATTEKFVISGQSGGDGGDASWDEPHDGGSGGGSVEIECYIDLSKVNNQLEVIVADERDGYRPGETGDDGESDDDTLHSAGDGGWGGGSTAVIGDGEILVEIGGGGGGGGGGNTGGDIYRGGDGGDGGGIEGGSGGSGGTTNGSSGGQGEVYIDEDVVDIITEESSSEPKVRIFD